MVFSMISTICDIYNKYNYEIWSKMIVTIILLISASKSKNFRKILDFLNYLNYEQINIF